MKAIDNNNYEIWLLRYADGDLTSSERKNVEQWLKVHPNAAEELALFNEAPRLQRNESVHYAPKPPQTKKSYRSLWAWSAAVAEVTLLVVTAVHLLTPKELPVEVAQVKPEVMTVDTDGSLTVPEKNTVADISSQVAIQPRAEAIPLLAEAAEESVPIETEPKMDEQDVIEYEELPLFVEEVNENVPMEAMATEPATPVDEEVFLYDDDLFVEDTSTSFEQQLLALNDAAKERLQDTYLGRRLARRLPEDHELLARVNEARERTPLGIRMVTDLVVKLIEVNNKDNNQQNSISL